MAVFRALPRGASTLANILLARFAESCMGRTKWEISSSLSWEAYLSRAAARKSAGLYRLCRLGAVVLFDGCRHCAASRASRISAVT